MFAGSGPSAPKRRAGSARRAGRRLRGRPRGDEPEDQRSGGEAALSAGLDRRVRGESGRHRPRSRSALTPLVAGLAAAAVLGVRGRRLVLLASRGGRRPGRAPGPAGGGRGPPRPARGAAARDASGSSRRARPPSSTATACASTPPSRSRASPGASGSSRRAAGCGEEVQDKPVGHPLPHLGERHLAPRRELQREPARRAARTCCATSSGTSVYNYLIDRFGRVFRVVDGRDQGQPRRALGVDEGRRRLPEPQQRLPGRLLRDALGGRPRPAHHRGPARRRAQPHRLPAPALGDRRPTCAWATGS